MPFKLELVWTLNFLLMIIHNATAGEILRPPTIVGDEGEDVDFKFTTNDSTSILAANFGIKKSHKCDDMLKMIIVTTNGITNGDALDTASGGQYKNRVHFIGNISLGRAWFRLKNVSVDDKGVYVACIRQVTDEIRIMHEVKLSVKPSSKKAKAGEMLPPKNLLRDEGEDVVFNFTTSNSIVAANFGIKKTDDCDDMLKLIIVTTKGVTNGDTLDTASGGQYKNRVHFIGNISLGRAWFSLKNVSVDDGSVYAACIRQVTDEIRIMHEVKLSVKPASKKESSALTPSASSTEGFSKLTTSSKSSTLTPSASSTESFSKLTTSSTSMPVSTILGKKIDVINECASNPCKNGGKCTDEVNRFKCTCAAGWTGDTCETNINECEPNPCKNGGSCQDQVNGYQCTCKCCWTGRQCELVANTENHPYVGITLAIVLVVSYTLYLLLEKICPNLHQRLRIWFVALLPSWIPRFLRRVQGFFVPHRDE